MSRPSIAQSMPHPVILFFSAVVGFISLSQEILWMRVIGYATGGAPEVFGNVLGFFLVGIALGALLGRRVCEVPSVKLMAFIGGVLMLAAVLYFFSVPLIALFRERNYGGTPNLPRGLMAAYILVIVIAFLQGGIFTVLCHEGVREGSAVGASVSWIYVANIVGSVAGPLLTGFVLLDLWTLQFNLLVISIATAVVGGLAWTRAPVGGTGKALAWVAVALCVGMFVLLQPRMEQRLLEKLQGWRRDTYASTLQNRSGIIAVEAMPRGVDIVYGGGAYDGRMNIDPDRNDNGIDRAYGIAVLHPGPKQVLEIGLSTGSWARILADYTTIERLTIVEINVGYLELISRYPEQASILKDPKVDIVIDDGRRWLTRNHGRKFDFILMNTTFHWRSQITNLVSREFLELAKTHLNPGGVIYYNTTDSPAIPYTAAQVFAHVVRYANFVAASDSPFDSDTPARRLALSRFRRDGRAVFSADRGKWMARKLTDVRLIDIGAKLRAEQRPEWLITDDNMCVEYKRGGTRRVGLGALLDNREGPPAYDRNRNWLAALRRLSGREFEQ